MVFRLIDKLLFGAMLLLALQLTQLADHYQQFLAGSLDATQWQVDGYQATATQHGYASVQAMIDHHLTNSDPSVKTDAQQKIATLEFLDTIHFGLSIFQTGNLMEQAVYMFAPSRFETLKKVLENFVPGIPLSVSGWVFGVTAGLLLNLLIVMPFWGVARWFKSRRGRRLEVL